MHGSFRNRIYKWIDERAHIAPAVEHVKTKEIAQHRHSVWYYFGGFALFLIAVQIISGIVLLTRYEPSATPAADAITGKPLCLVRAIDSVVVVTVTDSNLYDYSMGDEAAFTYAGVPDSGLPDELRGKANIEYTVSKDSIMILPYSTTAGIINPQSKHTAVNDSSKTQQLVADTPTAVLRQTPDAPAILLDHLAILRDTTTGEIIHPSAAYASIQKIVTTVPYGALIRSIHAYGANLLVACVLLHMFSVFLLHGYRKPNEIMWMTGVLLLAIVLGFGFTGYLLPWTKLSYFATRVGAGYPENFIPGIGKWIAGMMRGGREVTGETLSRMFDLHVVVLPLSLVLFAGIHIALLQVRSTSVPIGAKQNGSKIVAAILGAISLGVLAIYKATASQFDFTSPWFVIPITILPIVAGYFFSNVLLGDRKTPDGNLQPIRFYWNFAMRDYIVWLCGLVLLTTLAIYAPWRAAGDAGMPIDISKPLITPTGIHPEWYFMASFELLRLIPGEMAMILFAAGGATWFFIPFLDKDSQRGKASPRYTRVGVILVLGFLALTWLGYKAVDDEIHQAATTEHVK